MDHRCLALAFVLVFAATACGDNVTAPPDRDLYEPAATDPPQCRPNLDGLIEMHEIAPTLGLTQRLLVNPADSTVVVDPRGTGDDARHWDWSGDPSADQRLEFEAEPLADAWFAESFPGGEYLLPLDAAGTQEGVYSIAEDGVYLHGIASVDDDPGRATLLPYQEPVRLYRLPLTVGERWTAEGELVDATLDGLPYAAADTYEVDVVAAGTLELPQFEFAGAVAVRTAITVAPGIGDPTTVRHLSFFFECFGEVARATSHLDEADPDFTQATEVRRLGY